MIFLLGKIKQKKSVNPDGGFILVETLIALLILSVGFGTATAGLYTAGKKTAQMQERIIDRLVKQREATQTFLSLEIGENL